MLGVFDFNCGSERVVESGLADSGMEVGSKS